MRIKSLVVDKLYGSLDFEVEFYPDVNILIGINGCGKTSILNVLAWVLGPSLRKLAELQFKKIEVVYAVAKNGKITLTARKRKNYVELSIGDVSERLRIPIFGYADEMTAGAEQRASIDDMYERYRMENKENNILKTLEELEGPLYLPLDRRWSEGSGMVQTRQFLRYRRSVGRVAGPMSDVLSRAERYYRQRQTALNVFNEKLKEEFIEYAFSDVVTLGDINKAPAPWTVEEIKRRNETIVKALQQAGIEVPKEILNKYFKGLGKIGMRAEKEHLKKAGLSPGRIEWAMNMPQIAKIERLIKRMEKYNRQRNVLFGTIDAFQENVNSYFGDTGKHVRFDRFGDLLIQVGKKTEIRADLLSSGEAQLLILFAYLYFGFASKEEFVVMIDEPELSLHLQWQHRYIESVMKANPSAQFIFATHAPELAQDFGARCIEIKARNT